MIHEESWQNWLLTAPDELTPNFVVYHNSIESNGIFIGDGQDLKSIIAVSDFIFQSDSTYEFV